MRDDDPRRLRRAVAQLAMCTDEDVEWIMGTLAPAQRERLAALVEADAVALPVDDVDRRTEAFLGSVDAPFASRLRLAMGKEGGDGRLTARTREVLAAAARDVVAQVPLPARPIVLQRGVRGFLARLRGAVQ